MIHLRLRDLYRRVWFCIVSQLAVNMLLSSTVVYSFIHHIYPFVRKVVPCHSPPVAILTIPKPDYNVDSIQDALENSEKRAERYEKTSIIWVARQIVLNRKIRQLIMVTASAYERRIIRPRTLSKSRQSTLAAPGIMDFSRNCPLYILFSNVSGREARTAKHIKSSQAAKHPSIIHAINTNVQEVSLVRTLEASTKLKFDSSDGKINTQPPQRTDVSAVVYRAAESYKFENSRYTGCNKASTWNVQKWHENLKLSEKN